jgi:biopolymer transport protein ExbB
MSGLLETLRAGGPLMVPLGALCLAISFWVAALYPRLRRASASAPAILEGLSRGSREDVLRAAAPKGGKDPGALARIVSFALRPGAGGPAETRARLREARQAELPRYEREVTVLSAMVAAAPLVGLLGTVKGMIETFWWLSTRGGATMELLSVGVSEALVTTQVGLIVAVPGLVGLFAVRRRLARIEAMIDLVESRLVSGGFAEARP